ncbi:hypothetical protein [Rhodoferax sp. PAMC 29310]|uniref:hypothetical protein n=1 Tax=Rhodoferax sp. PAMC 29310 TaxID=2822760 RepID=UPI001B33665A|nr:hypothetical protein [Rhodoferax sp. PAMC 29310]
MINSIDSCIAFLQSQCKALRRAKDETIAWLHWYNKARLHSTLAHVGQCGSRRTVCGLAQASQFMVLAMRCPRNAWRPLPLIETRIEELLQIAWGQPIR